MTSRASRGAGTFGRLAPAAALALLGSEVRAEILWTLSEARGGAGAPPGLPFSTLRARVDADLDSSQFNYHLQELVGHFVERREEGSAQVVERMGVDRDAGYALRPEGTALVRTVRAGTVVGPAESGPVDVGLDCYHCGGAVEGRYRNWLFAIQCPDCSYLYDYNLTPPGVLEDDPTVLLDRVASYNRHVRLSFARGACPACGHSVDGDYFEPDGSNYPRGDLRSALVNRSCPHCGNMDNLTVGELALREPTLVAFCHDRGLDVTRTPIWELPFAATDRDVAVRSRDPWAVALELSVDGETLELVFDDSLALVDRTGP